MSFINPSLPTELISQIINSATSLHRNDFRARSEVLRAFSQVSWEWKEYAQINLLRSVTLESQEGLKGLLWTLEERPELRRRVREVQVRGEGYGEELREVFRLCQKVEEVTVKDVKEFNLDILMELPQLKTLSFIKVNFLERPKDEPFTLPTLQHLSLVRPAFAPGVTCKLVPFITPSQLPSLRILGLASRGKCSPEEYTALKSIFPQLDLLSLDAQEVLALGDQETEVATLYNMSIGLSATTTIPAHLNIKNLRLRWSHKSSYEALVLQSVRMLVATLRAGGALKEVKTILAPFTVMEKKYKSLKSATNELRAECEKRKIVLVDEEEQGEGEEYSTVSEEVLSTW